MHLTPAQVIKDKGAATIAHALGVKAVNVRVWRHRNAFPRSVWPDLIAAFPDLDIDALRAMEAVAA